jgi:hypothetical protein
MIAVPPPIVCLGSGLYAPHGWRWYPCPECGAAVWRDPDTLALVDHAPGARGADPESDAPAQD